MRERRVSFWEICLFLSLSLSAVRRRCVQLVHRDDDGGGGGGGSRRRFIAVSHWETRARTYARVVEGGTREASWRRVDRPGDDFSRLRPFPFLGRVLDVLVAIPRVARQSGSGSCECGRAARRLRGTVWTPCRFVVSGLSGVLLTVMLLHFLYVIASDNRVTITRRDPLFEFFCTKIVWLDYFVLSE